MKQVNYNEVADVYDQRYRTGGPTGIAECLQALVFKTRANRVLEAGCGTGQWLTLLHGCGFRCGLDYSARMLEKARQRDAALALGRGTATQLPFAAAAFDFVFCVHALHHFDDPQAFIVEAYRVIRKPSRTGGTCMSTFLGLTRRIWRDTLQAIRFYTG